MPLYLYQCTECPARETLVAGLDDFMVPCTQCPGRMLRLDPDIFQPYFDLKPEMPYEIPEDY